MAARTGKGACPYRARYGCDGSADPHFAGTPDMFLPRVPPHAPVTVNRQKHVGPAKVLSSDCRPFRSPSLESALTIG